MKVSIGMLLGIFFLALPPVALGAENAGLVNGVWFDAQSFSTTQPVQIYAAVHNETGSTLTGQVIFSVDAHDLAPVSFSVPAYNLVRVSTSDTFAAGQHSVTARIVNASADVETASAPARTITVVAPTPTTLAGQAAVVGATVANTGTTVINTVSPVAEGIANTLQNAQTSLLGGSAPKSVSAKTNTTAVGSSAPSVSVAANSLQNLFDVSLAIAGKTDVPLWKRILAIVLGVLAFLVRYWMWVLAVIVALVLWRVVRRR